MPTNVKVKQFVFNMFGVNTYLITDHDSGEAVVIDPGMFTKTEREEFDAFIDSNKLKLTWIINTHLHLDHCFGDNHVKDKYGVKIAANAGDAFLGADIESQLRRFGGRGNVRPVAIDIELQDGDTVNVGSSELHIIETPGHSPGGISLYCPQGKFLISGDTLFRRSVGRTDLAGGDAITLINSIHDKLFTLPDETNVLPGHDKFTTIGEEKKSNPYV